MQSSNSFLPMSSRPLGFQIRPINRDFHGFTSDIFWVSSPYFPSQQYSWGSLVSIRSLAIKHYAFPFLVSSGFPITAVSISYGLMTALRFCLWVHLLLPIVVGWSASRIVSFINTITSWILQDYFKVLPPESGHVKWNIQLNFEISGLIINNFYPVATNFFQQMGRVIHQNGPGKIKLSHSLAEINKEVASISVVQC